MGEPAAPTESSPPAPEPRASIGGETSHPETSRNLTTVRDRTNADTDWRPPPAPILQPAPSWSREITGRGEGDDDSGDASSASAGMTDSAPPLSEYIVQPGDSLAGIARILLGGEAQWRRLYEANRDSIPDPDRLQVGQRLRIPGGQDIRDGAAARVSDDSTRRAESSARENSIPGGMLRAYVVRPGDSLSSIARRLLGSESRWREIHALNRDRVPDPNRLRVGVELRIPSR